MDLLKELSFSNLQEGDFDKFKFILSNLLESHAPLKEKYIRRTQPSTFYEQECSKGYYGSNPTSQ